MNNTEIRIALVTHGIKQYVLADYLGITETALSRKLRKPLLEEERNRILKSIDCLAKEVR